MTDSAVGEMFDSLAGTYDADPFHPLVSDALVDGLEYGSALVADVACGTGIAAFTAVGRRDAGRVLAIDVSAGMIARAKAKAARLDREGRIEFSVGEAVPLPVSPGTVRYDRRRLYDGDHGDQSPSGSVVWPTSIR